MCVIAIKSAGAKLNWRTLQRCWEANPDGAGYAYHDNGRVYVSKGYMAFKDFKRAVKPSPISKSDEAMFHFRIATHGVIAPSNCHPFPLSTSDDELGALDIVTNVAIAHNGIIGGMADDDNLSDTMLFIRDYLAPLGADNVVDPMMHRIIGKAAASKLAIMSASGIQTLGTFEKHKGWTYSNASYKEAPALVDSLPTKYKNFHWPYNAERFAASYEDGLDDSYDTPEISDHRCDVCGTAEGIEWSDPNDACLYCGACLDESRAMSEGTYEIVKA